jgi:hypothetical protein
MANFIQFHAKLGANDKYGVPNSVEHVGAGDPEVLRAAVTAALAVLVADAASPTQAHVTTLNNAYTAYANSVIASTHGISVILNTTVTTTRNQLQAALKSALDFLTASKYVTN